MHSVGIIKIYMQGQALSCNSIKWLQVRLYGCSCCCLSQRGSWQIFIMEMLDTNNQSVLLGVRKARKCRKSGVSRECGVSEEFSLWSFVSLWVWLHLVTQRLVSPQVFPNELSNWTGTVTKVCAACLSVAEITLFRLCLLPVVLPCCVSSLCTS